MTMQDLGETTSSVAEPVLRVNGVSRFYDAVVALDEVSLEVHPGEVVGLLGDNGAGKSTLIKIIAGAIRPSAGSIHVSGEEVHFRSPADARAAHIETVYQTLALIDIFTVADNFYHGREITYGGILRPLAILKEREMRDKARQALKDLNIVIPGFDRGEVRQMSGGQRQAAAIARGAFWGKRLILLDEPTAALGVRESEEVLQLVTHLSSAGIPMVIVSHNLEHVFRVCDRMIVLRRGRKVADVRRDDVTPQDVVAYITGAR